MQQDDQSSEFKTPDQTNYFSSQPEAGSPDPIVGQDTSSNTEPAPEANNVDESTADVVQWQAPEYIQHERKPIWFVLLAVVVFVLMVVAIFVIKSPTFAILIPVMAAALLAYTYRPPAIVNYTLSGKGLYINDILHPFTEFRAFGVVQEEAEPSIVFVPVRRFRPGLTVYFPTEKGEAIVDLLGVRIPIQQMKPDLFDKIIRSIGL